MVGILIPGAIVALIMVIAIHADRAEKRKRKVHLEQEEGKKAAKGLLQQQVREELKTEADAAKRRVAAAVRRLPMTPREKLPARAGLSVAIAASLRAGGSGQRTSTRQAQNMECPSGRFSERSTPCFGWTRPLGDWPPGKLG
jgi:hypothetical protein